MAHVYVKIKIWPFPFGRMIDTSGNTPQGSSIWFQIAPEEAPPGVMQRFVNDS